jgi:hypothetical protein
MEIWWASDLWDKEHGTVGYFGSKAMLVANIVKELLATGQIACIKINRKIIKGFH